MAKPLALTSGEPAGIGPDIAIEAWLRRKEAGLPPFYLLGDRGHFVARAKTLGSTIEFADVTAETAAAAFPDALPVVATGVKATAQPGKPDGTSADAAIASIRQAVGDVAAGRACAVVTNPIAKSVLYRAGFNHPGHTEFLAELAGQNGRAPQPVMMLWSPALAVVPVTIHLALREAIEQLTSELIVSIRMPVNSARSAARTKRSFHPRSRFCATPASTHAVRCRPIPCSTRRHARPMTARSACITIRR
jgi:4-hydroxythreonine-4-phosphate dehydrogenase